MPLFHPSSTLTKSTELTVEPSCKERKMGSGHFGYEGGKKGQAEPSAMDQVTSSWPGCLKNKTQMQPAGALPSAMFFFFFFPPTGHQSICLFRVDAIDPVTRFPFFRSPSVPMQAPVAAWQPNW